MIGAKATLNEQKWGLVDDGRHTFDRSFFRHLLKTVRFRMKNCPKWDEKPFKNSLQGNKLLIVLIAF